MLAPSSPLPQAATGNRAARAFLAADPVMGPVVKQVGAFTLKPIKREPYEALVRAIAHQQVHGRAAEAMLNRLIAHFPGQDFPEPSRHPGAGGWRAAGLRLFRRQGRSYPGHRA
jgi:DNA-3-methyladenine glycosylase II